SFPSGWLFIVFFFFSSRRRHTRFSRDWSSDVCSSDLRILQENPSLRGTVFDLPSVVEGAKEAIAAAGLTDRCGVSGGGFFDDPQIGRASCRERVEASVIVVSV